MKALAKNLDHVGTVIPDIDVGRIYYEKLGFRMMPRSQHRGAVTPGGQVQLLGQGNHCAMLKQGYLEVMGVFDRTLPVPAQQYLDQHEGLHIVSFEPNSIDEVRALSHKTGQFDAPRELGREVDFGPQGLERRRVEFCNIRFRQSDFPEATFLYTEHLTRDIMWQPHLLEHPNGVEALNCAYVVSTDAKGTADRLAHALQVGAKQLQPGSFKFEFENSSLRILAPDVLERSFPGISVPATSRPAGYTVRTSSLHSVQSQLERNSIPFQRHAEGGVFVCPPFAPGNVIHFIEGQ